MSDKISMNLVKCYGLGASIVGIIQSFLWIVLCFIGILYYAGAIDSTFHIYTEENYLYFGFYFYNLFLNEKQVKIPDILISPKDFLIILCYYLIISLFWLAISIYFTFVFTTKRWQQSKYCIIPWTSLTAVIILSDLIVLGLFSYDLTVVQEINAYANVSYYLVIFLSGRGFVLWIINLIYVVFFVTLIVRDYANKPVDVVKPDNFNTRKTEALNRQQIDEEDVINNDEKIEETPSAFSQEFFEKLETTYRNVSNLPRLPYISHKALRPLTPPTDYSPNLVDRKHLPYRSVSKFEPLKY